jgi:hypothetical protein
MVHADPGEREINFCSIKRYELSQDKKCFLFFFGGSDDQAAPKKKKKNQAAKVKSVWVGMNATKLTELGWQHDQ